MSKTEQLQIRLTSKEKKYLKVLSDKAQMDVSAFVKSKIFPNHMHNYIVCLQNLAETKSEQDEKIALAHLNDCISSLDQEHLSMLSNPALLFELNVFLNNYIAAMVEHACALKKQLAPVWTQKFKGLDQAYFASKLHAVKLHLLKNSPIAFRKRNIFIDTSVGQRV